MTMPEYARFDVCHDLTKNIKNIKISCSIFSYF
jgi:hypothetical protein